MKILTKIIIAVIVISIVFGVFYVLFFGKAEAPQTIHENTSAVPSNWVIYTDKVSGISLQAPADFKIENHNPAFSDAKLFLLIIPTSTPYANTHLLHEALIAVNPPSKSCAASDVLEENTNTQKTVKINGVSFTRVMTGGVGAGNIYQGIDYTTVLSGLCYRVTLFTHSTNGEGFYTSDTSQIARIDAQQKKDIDALFKLFDQIASTIKFTK